MSDKETEIEENNIDVPIRNELVNTAVNFLLNPDVQKRKDENKFIFLKKKGLTDIEIAAAFDRVKSSSNYSSLSTSQFNNESAQIPPPIPYQYSFWSRISHISSSLIVFGVTAYGLHYFFKKYIRPWLLGEDENDSLTKNIIELNHNVSVLVNTVEKLHMVVVKQNEEINKLMQIEGYSFAPMVLEDVKREVSSLKSILINRHQFPAAPQLQRATIPTWQLQNNDQEKKPAETETNKVIPNGTPNQVLESKAMDSVTTNSDIQLNLISENSTEFNDTALDSKTNSANIVKLEDKYSVECNPKELASVDVEDIPVLSSISEA